MQRPCPNVGVLQWLLSGFCYCAEASLPMLLSCRGLCLNTVVVQRPLLRCFRASASMLLLCKIVIAQRLLTHVVLFVQRPCPNVGVLQWLLSQCCCCAEASLQMLLSCRGLCFNTLLCREALCPVVVGQRPLPQYCCEVAPVPMLFLC